MTKFGLQFLNPSYLSDTKEGPSTCLELVVPSTWSKVPKIRLNICTNDEKYSQKDSIYSLKVKTTFRKRTLKIWDLRPLKIWNKINLESLCECKKINPFPLPPFLPPPEKKTFKSQRLVKHFRFWFGEKFHLLGGKRKPKICLRRIEFILVLGRSGLQLNSRWTSGKKVSQPFRSVVMATPRKNSDEPKWFFLKYIVLNLVVFFVKTRHIYESIRHTSVIYKIYL